MLQKFCTPWRPVLQEFFTPWHPVLQKFCTVWRPQQQKFCRQWNPELKKFYMLQGQYCRNSESLLFYSQKRQIVEGPRVPTVSISFLFMLFLFFSDHSWNNNTVHADVFFLFSPTPPPTPTVHSNCKSKMAGRTNDRELLALARTNKTPALQARAQLGAAKRKSQTTTFLSEVFPPSNQLRIWNSSVSTNLINLKLPWFFLQLVNCSKCLEIVRPCPH